MTNTEKGIAEILSELYGVRFECIRSETLINNDLRIDGGDAVELLHHIKDRFRIDVSDFLFDRYFGPESLNIFALFLNVIRGRRPSFAPLSIGEFARYIDQKSEQRI